MIALLPALLLLWMQGAAPAEILDPRLTAELLVSMQRSGCDRSCPGMMAASAVERACSTEAQEEPSLATPRRGAIHSGLPFPPAPLLAGDRSRDGPLG